MKQLIIKLKQRTQQTWKWLRLNIINKETLVYAIIAEVIFWTPVWVPVLIGLITQNAWWFSISGTVIMFWLGPFTPAVFLQLGFIMLLKKIFKRRNK